MGGRLVDESEAVISVLDHGFTVGDGVFETLKVYRGRPFAVRRHLERLAASAAALGLDLPDAEVVRAAIDEVIDANRLASATLRVTVTSGSGPLGSVRGQTGPTVVVTAAAPAPWPRTADVVVVPWPRNERGALAGLKTTSYAENVMALDWARRRGGDEALFANLAGNLCEGTGTNVFLAVDRRLVTPPLRSGCLAGVTRALVIEACAVAEEDVTLAQLLDAPEAFLASTTREVQPIRAVDGRALPAAPGPLTAAAAEALAAVVARDIDP